MTEQDAIRILREKADVYDEHPEYPWLLPEDKPDRIGKLIAYEIRSTCDTLEWIASRQRQREEETR